MVARVQNLPPLNLVANQIVAQLSDEFLSLAELVTVIEQDTAISARLLRLANSALYQRPKPVLSLREAVGTVLGLDITRAVSLGIAFSAFAAHKNCAIENQRALWLDSLLMANCSRSVTRALPEQEEFSGIAYAGALLGNMGLLVLASVYPERVDRCFAAQQESLDGESTFCSLDRAVQSEFGFDHRSVAAALVSQWQLPAEFVPLVSLEAPSPENPLAQIVAYLKLVREMIDNSYQQTSLLPERWSTELPADVYDSMLETSHRFPKFRNESFKATSGIVSAH